MNNLSIMGRITKEPNLRKVLVNGEPTDVLNFTVAVDDGFRVDPKTGKKKDTEFIRVSAWRGAAKAIAEHCDKGREICVCGPVHLDKYTAEGKEFAYMGIPRPWYFEFGGSRVVNDTTGVPDDTPWEE